MYDVVERTSGIYTATLKDQADAVVPASTLATLTLTLYNVADLSIINSRNAQDVLNTNGVAVSEEGVLTWTIAPADNAIVNAARASELHKAVFVATWDTTKQMVHEVDIRVKNVGKVPAT